MNKPEELIEPLPNDIVEVKEMIASRVAGLTDGEDLIKQANENSNEYRRQLVILKEHALKLLGLDTTP